MDAITTPEALDNWLKTFSSHSREQLKLRIGKLSGLLTILASSKDAWWIRRELARSMYEFGQIYHPLPNYVVNTLESYGASFHPFHFVHLSTLDATKVAFTPSWEDGLADRQQQISLGKYIKKHHPHIPEFIVKQMQDYLNDLLATAEVKFTTDINLIKLIYQTCAGACMSKSSESYKTHPRHPLEAYSGVPGLSLAYIEKESTPIARCLVYKNPADDKDLRYVRTYGEPLIAAQLDKLGYRRASLEGVRLPKIRLKIGSAKCLLAPYIDDHSQGAQGTGTAQSIKVDPDDDDHIIICKNSDPGAVITSPYGYVHEPVWEPVYYDAFPEDRTPKTYNPDTRRYEWWQPRENGYVFGAYYWSTRTDEWATGYFYFRTLADLDDNTVPAFGGGRILVNDNSRAIGVTVVWDGESENASGEFWPVKKSLTNHAFVTARFAPEHIVRAAQQSSFFSRSHSVLVPRDKVTTDDLTGVYVLSKDIVQVTHGTYIHRKTHRVNTERDWLNPEHIYYSGDGSRIEYPHGSRWVPHLYMSSLADASASIYGSSYYDNRVSHSNAAGTGLLGKDFYLVGGYRFRHGLDLRVRGRYDEFVFAYEGEDMAVYVELLTEYFCSLSRRLIPWTHERNDNMLTLAVSTGSRTVEQAQQLLQIVEQGDFVEWLCTNVFKSPMFGDQLVGEDAEAITDDIIRPLAGFIFDSCMAQISKEQASAQATAPAEVIAPQPESTVDSPATQNEALDDLPF